MHRAVFFFFSLKKTQPKNQQTPNKKPQHSRCKYLNLEEK